MMSISNSDIAAAKVMEVSAGSTAVLDCPSNDFNHNFMFWLFNSHNTTVIGPGNDHDAKKYKYEVLSGKLKIGNVSPAESGYYMCVSENLDNAKHDVKIVKLLVNSGFTASDAVKLVAIIVSIIVLISCAVLYYRLRREWKKYDDRTIVPVDEMDDDEEGDDIYHPTTTSISQPAPGPSRNPSSEQLLYGIDNQGLDTDFNSVFENIQVKSPQRSLI